MKRYFLTASLLVFGGLNAFASGVQAAGDVSSVDVPFAGVALGGCTVVPLATPGILTVPTDDPKSMSSAGNLPGTLTVICNDSFSVQTKTPVETTPAALTQLAATTKSSSIRSIETPLGTVDSIVGTDLAELDPGLLYTIKVDMIATKDTNVEAGAYFFDVPVTVTCD